MPSVETLYEITDMCVWEACLLLRPSAGRSQLKHTSSTIAFNRQLWEANYESELFRMNEFFKSGWENSGISYRLHLLLFCPIFLTIFLSTGPCSPPLPVTILSFIRKLVSFYILFWGWYNINMVLWRKAKPPDLVCKRQRSW